MRNKIIALILTVFLVFCLAGCRATCTGSKNYTTRTNGRLQPTMMQDLYYDTNTKIVYILYNTRFQSFFQASFLLFHTFSLCNLCMLNKPMTRPAIKITVHATG